MRAGIIVSAVGHAGLIVLAVVGIGMTKPFEAMPVESIAVDLISIEEFSNIRRGTLNSTIVETETPSVVTDDTPAELAQPTGNTEEDQATPENTDVVTPAPTQQTAPEPVPEPEPVEEVQPEPEPEPEAQPEPAPVPEPVEDPEPVAPEPELAAPAVSEEPAEVAPQPRVRTAALDEKRAAYKKQQEDEKKKREAEARKKKEEAERQRQAKLKEDEAARPADEVASIINSEDSRGATTGSGGEASLGKETGTSARLSQSQIDALIAQISKCPYYNPPLGAADAGVTAQLEFSIDQSGNVTRTPLIVRAPASTLEQALASAAQRGVMRCGPYTVAAGQDVRAVFDPRLF